MGLLFYIAYRADPSLNNRGNFLVVIIHFLLMCVLPLMIIDRYIGESEKWILLITGFISILIFDYFHYLREIKQKEILKKYTYKYKIIDNQPLASFLITYFFLLSIWYFLTFSNI